MREMLLLLALTPMAYADCQIRVLKIRAGHRRWCGGCSMRVWVANLSQIRLSQYHVILVQTSMPKPACRSAWDLHSNRTFPRIQLPSPTLLTRVRPSICLPIRARLGTAILDRARRRPWVNCLRAIARLAINPDIPSMRRKSQM